MNKKKIAKITLNDYVKVFIVYIIFLSLLKGKLLIYPA